MTRHPIRFLTCALIAAAGWLALRNVPTTAQNPPAVSDAEKRLQALEQKLDRLLAKIDPQAKADHDAIQKNYDLLRQAREVLVTKLEQDEKAYAEFRQANPVNFRMPWSSNPAVVLMQKVSVERGEIQRRLRELQVHAGTIEKALRSPEDHAPAVLLLKRRGVDLSKLPGVPENDAAAQLRAYLRSLKLEAEEQTEFQQVSEKEFDTARNSARELQHYEVEADRLQARIAATRKLFEVIVKRMNELNLVKDLK